MSERTMAGKACGGVWSAAPTPFTSEMEVDVEAVERMLEHHARLGIKGLFLAGSNGEGPWMTKAQLRLMLRTVVRCNQGRLPLAFQVTDNSAARILDNIEDARANGADIAVIAPPYFLSNATPDNILKLYRQVIRSSALPVGIYDRGKFSSLLVPGTVLAELAMEKNVVMIKDSSSDMARRRIFLQAKRRRPMLQLLNGWEFNCVPYLKAGYDGLLLGGAAFNGFLAGQIFAAARAGKWLQAQRLQMRMNRMMYAVYGGKQVACWLAGEKYLLMRLRIFRTWRNYLGYTLTPGCRRAVDKVLKQDAEYLLP